jgi:hypothetical protein
MFQDRRLKALEQNDRETARKYVKLCFNLGGDSIKYLTDPEIEKLLNWLNGGAISQWGIMDWIFNGGKPSIADIVNDAEVKAKEGLGEDEVKDLYKPYFFGNIQEEKMNVKTDEEYEKVFKSTLAFVFDKEHKVDNKTKEAPKRGDLVKNFWEQNKDLDVKERIARTIRTLLVEVKKRKDAPDGYSSKSAYGEVISYIKKHDKESYNKYEELKKSRENKSKGEESKQENASDDSKKEDKSVETKKADVKEGESSPMVDISSFKKQATSFVKIEALNDFLITLMNKTPKPLHVFNKEQLEKVIFDIAKHALLTTDDIKEVADWKEEDVAEHLAHNVFK